MQNLIKNNELITDTWEILEKSSGPDALAASSTNSIMVPLNLWKLYRNEAEAYSGNIAIWLDSDEFISEIKSEIDEFSVIALNFPVFSDGRSYTTARELRQTLNYEGEIRAIGDVLRDQIFYMSRCGFDSFLLRPDQDAQACIDAFRDFQESYQSTSVNQNPLFRRR
ncbi:MAG: DUF934 domain-containing protein [Gammaproteobacteria bacterium]|nr:DUF934 domain-containing protein [Gammaproteobacteria bacterium]